MAIRLSCPVSHNQATHNVLTREILDNPVRSLETGKGIALSEFLVQQGVDVVLMKNPLHGKGPEYVFADAKTLKCV